MTGPPELDPHWIRHRRASKSEDPSNTVAVIVLVLIVAAAVYLVRDRVRQSEALELAQAAAQASANAQQRLAHELQEARYRQAAAPARVQSLRGVDASGSTAGAGSSIEGKAIHRCGYAGTTTYQAQPCQAPWQELDGENSSHQQRAYDDALVRQQAEERLRQEQARWDAAVGGARQFRGVYPPIPTQGGQGRARCAAAKRNRDAAYEMAGVNRSFEMIRRWSDIVFEACKET